MDACVWNVAYLLDPVEGIVVRMRVALAHVCLSAENAGASAAWLTVTAGVDTFELEYQTKVFTSLSLSLVCVRMCMCVCVCVFVCLCVHVLFVFDK